MMTSKMNKKESKKPAIQIRPSTTKSSRKTLAITAKGQSKSDESLLNNSTTETNGKKASTPVRDHTMMMSSPDISCITDGARDAKFAVPKKTAVKKNSKNLKPKAPTEDEVQLRLDIEYTRYLQAIFKSKLAERRAAEVKDKLQKTQERIKKDEEILRKTSKRLKNINFNEEIESLHTRHMPNYGKVLEKLDASNCEEYLTSINKKIDQTRNQLKMKKVEIPQGGIEQLTSTISEAAEAFKQLNEEQDNDIPKVLENAKKANENISYELSRAAEKLPEAESLVLTRATLEISQGIPSEYNFDSSKY